MGLGSINTFCPITLRWTDEQPLKLVDSRFFKITTISKRIFDREILANSQNHRSPRESSVFSPVFSSKTPIYRPEKAPLPWQNFPFSLLLAGIKQKARLLRSEILFSPASNHNKRDFPGCNKLGCSKPCYSKITVVFWRA